MLGTMDTFIKSSYSISREVYLRIQSRRLYARLKQKYRVSSTTVDTVNRHSNCLKRMPQLEARSIETIIVEQSDQMQHSMLNNLSPSTIINEIDTFANSYHTSLSNEKQNNNKIKMTSSNPIYFTFDIVDKQLLPILDRSANNISTQIEHILVNLSRWNTMGCIIHRVTDKVFSIAIHNNERHSTPDHLDRGSSSSNSTLSARLNQIELCLIISLMKHNDNHEDILSSMIRDNDMLSLLIEITIEQVMQQLWCKRYPSVFQPSNNTRLNTIQYETATSMASIFTRMTKQRASTFEQSISSRLDANVMNAYSEQTITEAFHQLFEHQHRKSLLWIASHLSDEPLNNQACSDTESSSLSSSWWSNTVTDWCESSSIATATSMSMSSSELVQSSPYKSHLNNDTWIEFSDATSFTDSNMSN